MRITSTQIAQLEKIIVDSNLTLDLFHKVRKDHSIYFGFKTDYFSFEISIGDDGFYHQKFQSVDYKKDQTSRDQWETAMARFKNWCSNIFQDIESEKKIYKEPDKKEIKQTQILSVSIKKISPKFVTIFDQAFQAEEQGLTEICGLGYRKAFEFLIKDYVIKKNNRKMLIKLKA